MQTARFEAERPYLMGLAYRMLGSRTQAEDILSEAYLRVHQQEPENARAYLTRVVTRLCLDHLKSAAVQREQYVGTWLPEPWVEPEADPQVGWEHRESLEMAFLLLLERLTPSERAAYLLREVFQLDYPEIAATLELSPANCRQLVHRAGNHLNARPRAPRPAPEKVQSLMHSFLTACAEGDLETLKAVLREDVLLLSDGGGKASAALRPVQGADRVGRFFIGVTAKFPGRSVRVAELNGQTALVLDDAVVLVDWSPDDRLQTIYVIRNPEKLGGLL